MTGAVLLRVLWWGITLAGKVVVFALGLAVAVVLFVIAGAWKLLTSGMRSGPRWKTDGFGGVRRVR